MFVKAFCFWHFGMKLGTENPNWPGQRERFLIEKSSLEMKFLWKGISSSSSNDCRLETKYLFQAPPLHVYFIGDKDILWTLQTLGMPFSSTISVSDVSWEIVMAATYQRGPLPCR